MTPMTYDDGDVLDVLNASSLCDDPVWSLTNCPVVDPDPCCFAREFPPTVQVLISTFLLLVTLVGMFGNALNVVALPLARRHCRDAHSPLLHATTVLVTSLSASDLLFNIGIFIVRVAEVGRGWPHGAASCTFAAFLWTAANASSLLHLDVIAIHRCLGVCLPRVCAVVFDSWKGLIPVVITWSVAIGLFIPIIHSDVYGYLGYNPRIGLCSYYDIIPAPSNYMYRLSGFYVAAPMIFIPTSSLLVFLKVRKSRRQVQAISSCHSTTAHLLQKRERQLTTIFVTISSIYIVCTVPFLLTFAFGAIDLKYRSVARDVIAIVYCTNFSVNFILYASRVPAYRDAYLLCWIKTVDVACKTAGYLHCRRRDDDQTPAPKSNFTSFVNSTSSSVLSSEITPSIQQI